VRAVVEPHPALVDFDRVDTRATPQTDICFGVVVFLANGFRLARLPLGKRWLLVGQSMFFADKRHRSRKMVFAQSERGTHSAFPGAYNDDPWHHSDRERFAERVESGFRIICRKSLHADGASVAHVVQRPRDC
jgi:hypothetical protein